MNIFKKIKKLEDEVMNLRSNLEDRAKNIEKVFEDIQNLQEGQSTLRSAIQKNDEKVSNLDTNIEFLFRDVSDCERVVSRIIRSLEGNIKMSYELHTKIGHCAEDNEKIIQQLKEATRPHSIETLMKAHQENENRIRKLREELNEVGE